MMRHAKLGDKGEDMIKTWTAGSFREDEVIKALRRLDKVTTDRGDRQFFGEDESTEVGESESFPTMNEEDDPDDEEYVYVFEDDLWE
eukprot:2170621-Pyramimonas_sp.AAC.1